MSDAWKFAQLDSKALQLVKLAEETLGADYVLAFEEGSNDAPPKLDGLAPAPLDDSRLECLEGLEEQLGVVAVAYCRVA